MSYFKNPLLTVRIDNHRYVAMIVRKVLTIIVVTSKIFDIHYLCV